MLAESMPFAVQKSDILACLPCLYMFLCGFLNACSPKLVVHLPIYDQQIDALGASLWPPAHSHDAGDKNKNPLVSPNNRKGPLPFSLLQVVRTKIV